MEKRAEVEGKAQAKAYMQAKEKAEREEEQKFRDAQAKKAREMAEILRTKVEPDEVAPQSTPSAARRYKRKRSVVKPVFFTIVGVLALAIVALHVVPLRPYAQKIERSMSAWLHDDVSIGSVTFRVYPTPHLNVTNFAVGKLLDAKASEGRIYLDIATLFGDNPKITTLELDNVTISSEAVRRIPTWGRAEGKGAAGGISQVVLRGVKMDTKPQVDPFDANLIFTPAGALRQASLRGAGGAWTLVMRPDEKGYDIDFNVNNWTLPIGAAVPVATASLKGRLEGSQITVPDFEAHVLEGTVNGTLQVNWQSGVHMESELSVTRINAKDLITAFTPDIAVTGKLDGNFTVAADGPTLPQLFDSPRVQGKFKLAEGSVSNADLVAVMQSDAAGQRAGVTKFAELTGEYAAADKRASFKQLTLQGGVLRGSGGVDIAGNSALAGHLTLEIRSQVAQDRGAFTIAGTVARPIIHRGG